MAPASSLNIVLSEMPHAHDIMEATGCFDMEDKIILRSYKVFSYFSLMSFPTAFSPNGPRATLNVVAN